MPPEVISKAHTLERTSKTIVSALDRDGVERALNVRESYKMMAETLLEARNITDDAMQAVEAGGGQGVSATSIEATLTSITRRHAETTVGLKPPSPTHVSPFNF